MLIASPCWGQNLVISDVKFREGSKYVDYCADANNIGCWRFNEDITYAIDDSGGDFHGGAVGATIVSGKEGNAREFSGTGQYIDIRYSDYTSLSAFSVVAWVYLDSRAGDEWKGILTIGGNSDRNILFALDQAGEYSESGYEAEGGANHFVTGSQLIPTETWCHLGVVWNGTTVQLYYNGEPDGSAGAHSTASATSNGFGVIGKNIYDASSYEWDGKIDEVGLFKDALSAAEVKDIYLHGLR